MIIHICCVTPFPQEPHCHEPSNSGAYPVQESKVDEQGTCNKHPQEVTLPKVELDKLLMLLYFQEPHCHT